MRRTNNQMEYDYHCEHATLEIIRKEFEHEIDKMKNRGGDIIIDGEQLTDFRYNLRDYFLNKYSNNKLVADELEEMLEDVVQKSFGNDRFDPYAKSVPIIVKNFLIAKEVADNTIKEELND